MLSSVHCNFMSRTDALTVAKFLQHRIWPRFTHQLRAAIRGAQSGHEKATDPRPPDCSDRPRNFSAQTTLPMTGVSAGRSSLFIDLVLAAFAQAISVGLLRLPTTADFQYQNPSGSGPVFRVAFQPLAAPDLAPLERRFASAVIPIPGVKNGVRSDFASVQAGLQSTFSLLTLT